MDAILFLGIIILCLIINRMWSKNRIILELDERYFNQVDLRNAVVEQLRKKGHGCEIIDSTIVMVDNKKYFVYQINFSRGCVPVQQIILKKMK